MSDPMYVVHNGQVCIMVKRAGKWVYIPEREYSYDDTPL